MKARLKIRYDDYDGSWTVTVEDDKREELFFNRTLFKWSAWLSFFIWKHITIKLNFGKDVDKNIEL